MFFCNLKKLGTVFSHYSLVGCTHALPVKKGFFGKLIRNLDSAHGFNDDIHLGIVYENFIIFYEQILMRITRKISLA